MAHFITFDTETQIFHLRNVSISYLSSVEEGGLLSHLYFGSRIENYHGQRKYPHMTVYDNIAFGLKLRKYDKAEIDRRVNEAGEILGLTDFLQRKPADLSGGQRQRVAMGRAIVRDAKVFLMDEPLSNLDAKLRVSMRTEIAKITRKIGATTIYVTHDQTEAMTLADRIVIMNATKNSDGSGTIVRIEQIGIHKNYIMNP